MSSPVAALLPAEMLSASPAETMFWSGAGISADPPTCGPKGDELAERALQHAFAPETVERIRRCYAKLRVRERSSGRLRSYPRPETVLDVVRRVHGLELLLDLLSDLRDAPPNPLHGFFARHLDAGGAHVTANFDGCIEASLDPERAGAVEHFHESFVGDPTGEKLAATLAHVEAGLPPRAQERLAELLADRSIRLVVVLGYSGSDYFDVDPYLRQLRGSDVLRGKTVVWVDHCDGPPQIRSGRAAEARRQLKWLAAAGATVHELSARTRDVLGALGECWDIALASPAATLRPEWNATLVPDDEARARASLHLFALMGLHLEVLRTFAQLREPSAQDLVLVAQMEWARGRYRDAARTWRRAYGPNGLDAWASLEEREGACLWIRGQYRRAHSRLRRAISRAEESPAAVSEEERLLLAETLGRVLVHMSRCLDARFFATRSRRRFALERLPDPDEAEGETRTAIRTHLSARLSSVRQGLGAPLRDPARVDLATEAFDAYEALHARLNYRHGALRARVRSGGHVPPARFRRLRCDFETIGAQGDAARMAFIPTAASAFPVRVVYEDLLALDIAPWHRLRLAVGYVADRLGAPVRRARRSLRARRVRRVRARRARARAPSAASPLLARRPDPGRVRPPDRRGRSGAARGIVAIYSSTVACFATREFKCMTGGGAG